jgi:hypothetical protein
MILPSLDCSGEGTTNCELKKRNGRQANAHVTLRFESDVLE